MLFIDYSLPRVNAPSRSTKCSPDTTHMHNTHKRKPSIIGYRHMQPIIDGAKTAHIQANTFICGKSSIKDKTCQQGKVMATGKFVNQYKNKL